MDFFKRISEIDSLEGIGVLYDEVRPTRASSTSSGANPREVRIEMRTDRASSRQQDELSEGTTTDYYSRSSMTTTAATSGAAAAAAAGSGAAGAGAAAATCCHQRESSLGFTFSGQPRDVARFRSCIPFDAPRGSNKPAPSPPPAQSGPFTGDILRIILLFVDVSSQQTVVAMGSTCRMWHFYTNFAPHWSYFRRKNWNARKVDLPKYIRTVVAKPKIVTREEYVAERRKVEECKRVDKLISTAKHLRWCVAVAIMVAAMTTANFVVAYFLGFMRTALRSDVELAVTSFLLMAVMTLLEVTVVIIPLGGVSSPSKKAGMLRVLSWGVFILSVSVVLGTITSLAFTRVQASGRVLDGPTVDFTMDVDCSFYPSNSVPSFALLPAPLEDIRWQPLTMDDSETALEPYCVRRRNDESTQQCFNLLYFDAYYQSPVFLNVSNYKKYKDVGSSTALGFDPTEMGKPIPGAWCQATGTPQMIALSAVMYAEVIRQRDEMYPSMKDWLDPSVRPKAYYELSYRCSSSINRETTEFPRGSAELWFGHSVPWSRHHVPLLTRELQVRSTFQRSHDHYLKYVFTCYVIAAILWGLQLLAQCVFKKAAVGVLGATTSVVLLVLNPVTMIISGALCVHVSDWVFMCSASSGGALIGAGVSMLFLLATVYVSASG